MRAGLAAVLLASAGAAHAASEEVSLANCQTELAKTVRHPPGVEVPAVRGLPNPVGGYFFIGSLSNPVRVWIQGRVELVVAVCGTDDTDRVAAVAIG